MTRILSADLLVADVIAPMSGRLAELAEKFGLKPGGKAIITTAQFDALSAAVVGSQVSVAPGGSSANLLWTLAKLLGDEIAVQFIGVAGEGDYCGIIRASLEDARIALLPEIFSSKPVAAVSFVLVYEDGQRTIATWPGNAREILKPEIISDEMARDCDVLLVQGSLWHKLPPAFPDRLVALSQKYHKKLWLTLPTQAQVSAEDAARYKTLIPHADVLLGNDGEVIRVFGGSWEHALGELQKYIEQLAFITCGHEGAVIVTKDAITHIDSAPIAAGNIVNTLGAGDTAFAGFVAGYLKGFLPMECAQIAMALAGEKLRINAPRLPDPKASVAKLLPKLAERLLQ